MPVILYHIFRRLSRYKATQNIQKSALNRFTFLHRILQVFHRCNRDVRNLIQGIGNRMIPQILPPAKFPRRKQSEKVFPFPTVLLSDCSTARYIRRIRRCKRLKLLQNIYFIDSARFNFSTIPHASKINKFYPFFRTSSYRPQSSFHTLLCFRPRQG